MYQPSRLFSILLLCVLLTASSASAQLTISPEVKLGFSRANIQDLHNDEIDTRMRTGIAAGGGLSISRGGPVAFRAELLFSQKGSVETSEQLYGGGTITHAINYLELPLLAQLQPSERTTLSPSLYAGPTAAVKLSEQVQISGGAIACDCGGFRHTELGFAVGGGIAVPAFANYRILVDGRYTRGLTGIADDHTHGNPEHQGRNHAFTVMIGLGF